MSQPEVVCCFATESDRTPSPIVRTVHGMNKSRDDWQTTLVLRGALDRWLAQSGAVSALPDAPVVQDRGRLIERIGRAGRFAPAASLRRRFPRLRELQSP